MLACRMSLSWAAPVSLVCLGNMSYISIYNTGSLAAASHYQLQAYDSSLVSNTVRFQRHRGVNIKLATMPYHLPCHCIIHEYDKGSTTL